MITKMAWITATWLGRVLQSSDDEVEVFSYGLEIFLGAVIKVALLLLIASTLGIIMPVALVSCGIFGFRFFGGGSHLKTYPRCLAFGILVIVGLSWLSTYSVSQSFLLILLAITTVLGIVIIIKYVPAGTKKKSLSDPREILAQKEKSKILLLLWSLISLNLVLTSNNELGLSLFMGGFMGLYSITPWGYAMTNYLDDFIDYLERGNIDSEETNKPISW
ncbi:MAG: accessory gene regulator ArgB-like protein [Ignavibacteriales bacterium]